MCNFVLNGVAGRDNAQVLLLSPNIKTAGMKYIKGSQWTLPRVRSLSLLWTNWRDIDGLVQDCRNSIANALQITAVLH